MAYSQIYECVVFHFRPLKDPSCDGRVYVTSVHIAVRPGDQTTISSHTLFCFVEHTTLNCSTITNYQLTTLDKVALTSTEIIKPLCLDENNQVTQNCHRDQYIRDGAREPIYRLFQGVNYHQSRHLTGFMCLKSAHRPCLYPSATTLTIENFILTHTLKFNVVTYYTIVRLNLRRGRHADTKAMVCHTSVSTI